MIVIVESSSGPIPFEVEGGVVRSGGADAVRGLGHPKPEQISERLETALQVVGRVADSMRQALQHVSVDSAEVTIGVKLTAEAGFIVAKTAGEATISVKIKLDKQPLGPVSAQNKVEQQSPA